PVRAPDVRRGEHIARWIGDLDSEDFAVREAANRGLEAVGESARPALMRALAGKPSAEARRRLEQLVAGLDGPTRRRAVRSVEVLERIGTAPAREILERLARGEKEARLTEEVRAALARLAER